MISRKSKYIHDDFIHNTKAAERIVPFLIRHFNPASVIDVGCGTGTWLKIFKSNGVDKITGIEGPHLDVSKLQVEQSDVLIQNLEKPFSINEKYDMAVCLEVAEHLKADFANVFVKQLVQLSNIVYFSAAVPYQGGQNHINEQWLSYWINIFENHDFVAYDIIRPQFWDDSEVEFWYAQNSCIFIHKNIEHQFIKSLPTFCNKNIVHPHLMEKCGGYLKSIYDSKISFWAIVKMFLKKIKNTGQ